MLRSNTTLILIYVIAIIAVMQGGCLAADLLVSADLTALQGNPLAIMTATDYLSNASFFTPSADDGSLSFAAGSSDPGFDNRLNWLPAPQYRDNSSTMTGQPVPGSFRVDSGTMPTADGLAMRIADGLGRVSVVHVSWATPPLQHPGGYPELSAPGGTAPPTAGGVARSEPAWFVTPSVRSGATSPVGSVPYVASFDPDVRRLVQFVDTVNRARHISMPLGRSDHLDILVQTNSRIGLNDVASTNTYSLLAAFVGRGFAMQADPGMVQNGQAIERLKFTLDPIGTRSTLTIRNLAWRQNLTNPLSPVQPITECVSGGAWVATEDYAAGGRESLSAAVSKWNQAGSSVTTSMITGQYYASAGRTYGIGLCSRMGSAYPFASLAASLPRGGRLYVSAGAPLDYETRVPFTLRWTAGW